MLAPRGPRARLICRTLAVSTMLACAPGCGDETALGPTPPIEEPVGGGAPGCEPGEIEGDDGACQPAGLPADLPPAGPPAMPAAGVPPDGCAAGFESDGEGGCDPILPSEPCPPGLMAVPGETECREVAPCGQGPWGEIPVEPDTQYVDQSFVGSSDGSSSSPWTTIQEGVDAAAPGAVVAVAEGSYADRVAWTGKAVRLWGRCPALVEIAVAGDPYAVIADQADGSEIRGLSVTSSGYGVMVQFSTQVVVDRLWVHDTGSLGVTFLDCTAGVLGNSLLEAVTGNAVEVANSEVTIDRVAVRDTQMTASGTFGRGVEIGRDSASELPAAAVLSGSIIERSHQMGVMVRGSTVDVVATAIRDTMPSSEPDPTSLGLAYSDGDGYRCAGAVTGSVIEIYRDHALSVQGGEVTIDTTTFRERASDGQGVNGHGIAVRTGWSDGPDLRTTVAIRRSLVAHAQRAAVLAVSTDVTMDRVLVRDTVPAADSGYGGYGVHVARESEELGRGTMQIDSCFIEQSYHAGVQAMGADLIIVDSVIRETLPPGDGTAGAGVALVPDMSTRQGATGVVRTTRIERSHGMGLLVQGSEATVVSSVIHDTQATAGGYYGLGVVLERDPDGARANATLDGSVVSQSHGSGVAVIGSDVALVATVVRDSQPGPGAANAGRGLVLQPGEDDQGSTGSVRSCLLEGNYDAGVYVWSSDLVFEGSIVQDTQPATNADHLGYGILLTSGPDGLDRSNAVVRGSVLQRNQVVGLAVNGSDATVESTLVMDTEPQSSSDHFGRCVAAQHGAAVSLSNVLLQRCHEAGLSINDADGRVVDTVVREIWPHQSDGWFGDGILVNLGERGASVDLLRTRVETTSRAGVLSVGGLVTVTDSTFECNPIDLDAETRLDTPALFTDGGGNLCGCDGVLVDCVVTSTNLAPPEALPD